MPRRTREPTHHENKARRRNICDNLLTYFNPYQSYPHSPLYSIIYSHSSCALARLTHGQTSVACCGCLGPHMRDGQEKSEESRERRESTRSDICRRWYGHRGALKMSSWPWGGKQQRQQQHLALSSSLTRNLAECDLADSWLSLGHFAVQSLPPDGKETNGVPRAQLLQLRVLVPNVRDCCVMMMLSFARGDARMASRHMSRNLIAYCRGENARGLPGGVAREPRHLCTLLSDSFERELNVECLFLVPLSQRHFVILSFCLSGRLWDCLWHCMQDTLRVQALSLSLRFPIIEILQCGKPRKLQPTQMHTSISQRSFHFCCCFWCRPS